MNLCSFCLFVYNGNKLNILGFWTEKQTKQKHFWCQLWKIVKAIFPFPDILPNEKSITLQNQPYQIKVCLCLRYTSHYSWPVFKANLSGFNELNGFFFQQPLVSLHFSLVQNSTQKLKLTSDKSCFILALSTASNASSVCAVMWCTVFKSILALSCIIS